MGVSEFVVGMPHRIAKPVADAIHERSPEVAQQGTLALRLEGAEVAHRVQDCVLHDIGGVDGIPRPPRNAAMSPPVQGGQVPLKQTAECLRVACACSSKQL
jgi:hypothetical protein